MGIDFFFFDLTWNSCCRFDAAVGSSDDNNFLFGDYGRIERTTIEKWNDERETLRWVPLLVRRRLVVLSISNAALDYISLFQHTTPRSLLVHQVHSKTGRPFLFNSFLWVWAGGGGSCWCTNESERQKKKKRQNVIGGGVWREEKIFFGREGRRGGLFKSLLLSLAIFFFFRLETPFSFILTCFINLLHQLQIKKGIHFAYSGMSPTCLPSTRSSLPYF